MAKFRPAQRRPRGAPPASTRTGVGCIILLVSAIVLAILFLYFVLKYGSNG